VQEIGIVASIPGKLARARSSQRAIGARTFAYHDDPDVDTVERHRREPSIVEVMSFAEAKLDFVGAD